MDGCNWMDGDFQQITELLVLLAFEMEFSVFPYMLTDPALFREDCIRINSCHDFRCSLTLLSHELRVRESPPLINKPPSV